MNVAAISSVTSTFVSQAAPRLQGAVGAGVPTAPASTGAASAAATAQKAASTQTVNFGPAVQVQLSQQAQALIAQQSATANNNSGQTAAQTANQTSAQPPSQASLALTYQSTAEQAWVQVLSSLGYTQQELDALPLSQRLETEAKASTLTDARVSAQVSTPTGVSDTEEANAISTAVQAVVG
jgi:hypothetical protein